MDVTEPIVILDEENYYHHETTLVPEQPQAVHTEVQAMYGFQTVEYPLEHQTWQEERLLFEAKMQPETIFYQENIHP